MNPIKTHEMVCWIAIGCNTMNIDLIIVLGKLVLIIIVAILVMEKVEMEMEKVMERRVLSFQLCAFSSVILYL